MPPRGVLPPSIGIGIIIPLSFPSFAIFAPFPCRFLLCCKRRDTFFPLLHCSRRAAMHIKETLFRKSFVPLAHLLGRLKRANFAWTPFALLFSRRNGKRQQKQLARRHNKRWHGTLPSLSFIANAFHRLNFPLKIKSFSFSFWQIRLIRPRCSCDFLDYFRLAFS